MVREIPPEDHLAGHTAAPRASRRRLPAYSGVLSRPRVGPPFGVRRLAAAFTASCPSRANSNRRSCVPPVMPPTAFLGRPPATRCFLATPVLWFPCPG